MAGMCLGGDKSVYRNLGGRVTALDNYHYFRCNLKSLFLA